MLVVPLGSCTRVQNRCRNWLVPTFSVQEPNSFRSLLFGGIDPSITEGTAVSSLVPLPKELSPDPLVRSALIVAVNVSAVECVLSPSQSVELGLRLSGLSTWVFPSSTSKLLLSMPNDVDACADTSPTAAMSTSPSSAAGAAVTERR